MTNVYDNMFIKNLNSSLDKWHLLKHPFYKEWSAGSLPMEVLREYGKQYYHHIKTFPRCISAMHSLCNDDNARRILLENLMEEELGDKDHSDHPSLWRQFVIGLGEKNPDIEYKDLFNATKKLIDGYYELSRSSYPKGIGALYAYERQVPSVSESKIDGLVKFYGVDKNSDTLKFFNVHMTADVEHSRECAELINNLSSSEKEEATYGAEQAVKLLWGFLDDMETYRESISRKNN
ncbi:MAG: CADD family putative folate metabolism protein [Anaplasmataceae bacterium]|nr:CADD family putative folate metabolism protein [Anaplasmataceae bacterium]